MLSLTSAHFETPEFLRLSEHGQAYLRAMWNVIEILKSEGGDPSASGESGLEYNTPKMKEALALVDAARDLMTDTEAAELSEYAHRCDYPEMYEEFIPKSVAFCPYCLALASAPDELPPCACPKDYLDAKPSRLVDVRIGGTEQMSHADNPKASPPTRKRK